MKNVTTRNLIQLIFNFAALALSLTGLFTMGFSKDFSTVNLVKYFTLLSNMVLCLACLVGIPFNLIRLTGNNFKTPRPLFVIRYVACVSILITFLTVVIYLDPSSKYQLFYSDVLSNLCLHYLAPICFIIGFIFFELDSKRKFISILWAPFLVAIYSSYAIPLVSNKTWKDPYGFLDFSKYFDQCQWWIGLIVVLSFLASCILLGFIVLGINRLIGRNVNKFDPSYQVEKDDFVPVTMYEDEVIVEEEMTIEEEPLVVEGEEIISETKKRKNPIKKAFSKAKKEKVETPIEEKTTNKENNSSTGIKRTYHIAKRQIDGMWQVKFANGKRALKLFATQAEAIEFTKNLINKNNGAMLVHNSKGKNKGRIKSK